MTKAKEVNWIASKGEGGYDSGTFTVILEERRQERIATLEEVLKEFNEKRGSEYDNNGDYLGEAIDVDEFGDWLEQQLKEAKG